MLPRGVEQEPVEVSHTGLELALGRGIGVRRRVVVMVEATLHGAHLDADICVVLGDVAGGLRRHAMPLAAAMIIASLAASSETSSTKPRSRLRETRNPPRPRQ